MRTRWFGVDPGQAPLVARRGAPWPPWVCSQLNLFIPPMRCVHDQIELSTYAPLQVIDITAEVRERLVASGLQHGLLTLISRHTTARLNLNENEEQLQRDMVSFLKRLVPKDGDYLHNLAPVDDRENAHSHLLGLFVNASECIPVQDGELLLGEWQSVFFVELDGPRPSRQVLVQCLGVFAEDAG